MFRSGKSLSWRCGVGFFIVVGAGVVLASPVFAFVSHATRTVNTKPLRAASVTATCPAGERVQFGGFQGQLTEPPPSSSAIVLVTGMRITGAGNQSTVDGQDFTTSARAAHLTSVAYCYRGAALAKFTATAVIKRHSGSATATCPTGQVVVAAGFASQAGISRGHDINRIERLGTNRLRVTLVNTERGTSSLTAIAYCGAGPAPVLVAKSVTTAKGRAGTVGAKCPSGTSLTFGGVTADASIESGSHPVIYPMRISADNTTVWRVSGWNIGTAGGKLTALAYCR